MNNEVILYKDGELELPVEVAPDRETVWLNRNQLAVLFDRDVKTIGKHINNVHLKKNLILQLSQNLRQLLLMEKHIR